MLPAILFGLAIGFIGSIPIAGPVAALVVERGLEGRFRGGAYIALGGALPEGGYAYLACWGFSTFLVEYAWIELTARGAAALLMVGLGIKFLRYRSKAAEAARSERESGRGAFALGFSITALNPTLIATWTAATTTLCAIRPVRLGATESLGFAGGATVGVIGWFLLLLGLMRRYRDRFQQATLERAIRGIGGFLLLGAAWFAWRFVSGLIG